MTEEKIISSEDVKKVAELARIEIDSEEKQKFAKEISSVLEYFKDLNRVEIGGSVSFDHFALSQNQFKDDEVKTLEDDQKEELRKNFPGRKENHLKVKEVLSPTSGC